MNTNLEAARASVEHFREGNMEAFLAMIDPNCAWTLPPGSEFGGTYRGPKEILERFFMPLSEALDFQMHVRSIAEAGEDIVVMGTYKATVRANGKKVECEFVQVGRWVDGKLVRMRDFTDTHTFSLAMAH